MYIGLICRYSEAILKFRNIIKEAKCDTDKKVTIMKFQQEMENHKLKIIREIYS